MSFYQWILVYLITGTLVNLYILRRIGECPPEEAEGNAMQILALFVGIIRWPAAIPGIVRDCWDFLKR